MKTRSLVACAAALSALCGAASAVDPMLGVKCPCQPGPYPGTTVTKGTATFPNGDKFKEVCTNQSDYGNFLSKYCPAGGGEICIGECVYPGGLNDYCATYDDMGNPCLVIHKNVDPGMSKPHQLKIYVYDVKNGTVTTYCYKRLRDGSYMPYGTPTCRRVTTPSGEVIDEITHDQPMDEILEEPGPKGMVGSFGLAAMMPQVSNAATTVASEAHPTGSRDLVFHTPALDVPFARGDAFTLHGVSASDLRRVHPSFSVVNRSDGVGVRLIAQEDGALTNGESLARVSSSVRAAISVHGNSVGAASLTDDLVAIQCADVVPEASVFATMSIDVFANVDAASEAVDANHDGVVNATDLALVLGAFGTANEDADANGDGVVNNLDLAMLLTHFGYRDE